MLRSSILVLRRRAASATYFLCGSLSGRPLPLHASSRGGRPGVLGEQSANTPSFRTWSALLIHWQVSTRISLPPHLFSFSTRSDAIRQRIICCAQHMARHEPACSASEAFCELRGASVYDTVDPSPVRPLDPRLISLPASGSTPVPLEALLGYEGPNFVSGFIQDSVLEQNVARVGLACAPPLLPATPYFIQAKS